MRTVLFGKVLSTISRMAGWGKVTEIDDVRRGKIIDYINNRMGIAWEWDWWPELMRVENRAYRDTWVVTYAYSAGNEVYNAFDLSYYTCLIGNSGVRPDTDASKWELLDVEDKYIGYTQYDKAFIGHVEGVYTRNPWTSVRPGKLAHSVSDNGVQLSPLAPDLVWLSFRTRVAVFGNDEHDPDFNYVAGDVIYDEATGNCFEALETSGGGEYWGLVEFPYILKRYIVRAVYSDIKREDGLADRAAYEESKAEGWLMDTQDIEMSSQGVFKKVSVNVY